MFQWFKDLFKTCNHVWVVYDATYRKSKMCYDRQYGEERDFGDYTLAHYQCSVCNQIMTKRYPGKYTPKGFKWKE